MTTTERLVIEALAESEASLLEERKQLLDLIVDLTWDIERLRCAWKHEHIERIHSDAALRRIHHAQQRKGPSKAAA